MLRIRIQWSQWRPLSNLRTGTSLHPMGAWTQKLIIGLKLGFSKTFIHEFNIDLYALVLNKSKDFFGEQFRTYPEQDCLLPTANCTMTFSNVGVINSFDLHTQ